jgi:hypothetical protein
MKIPSQSPHRVSPSCFSVLWYSFPRLPALFALNSIPVDPVAMMGDLIRSRYEILAADPLQVNLVHIHFHSSLWPKNGPIRRKANRAAVPQYCRIKAQLLPPASWSLRRSQEFKLKLPRLPNSAEEWPHCVAVPARKMAITNHGWARECAPAKCAEDCARVADRR